jgi:hypothetical protein
MNFLVVFLLIYSCSCFGAPIMTQAEWGGRTGDHLVQFVRALWLARQQGMDFYWYPFKYAEQFKFSQILPMYPGNISSTLPRVRLYTPDALTKKSFKGVYLFDYTFGLSPADIANYEVFKPIVKDHAFMRYIKELIAPINHIPSRPTQENYISVALHVRTGIGCDFQPLYSLQFFDEPDIANERELAMVRDHYRDWVHPFKFLPLQYYVNQINMLSELLPNVPLYIYLFTDHPKPEELCSLLQEKVNRAHIVFDCHKKTNAPAPTIVQDLFDMAYNFDVFIRGGSNVSLIADLVGKHKLVIRPVKVGWYGKRLTVTKIDMVGRDQNFVRVFNLKDYCTDGLDSVMLT